MQKLIRLEKDSEQILSRVPRGHQTQYINRAIVQYYRMHGYYIPVDK